MSIVVGKDFFLNWLGTDFKNSYLITVLFVIPGLITRPQQIASATLIASNRVRYNAFSKIVVAVISISLSYILSLRYGATGAGISILIGNMIGGGLVLNIIYARVLKINVWEFFRKCQVSMALPFILVLMAGLALNYFITDVSWLNTISKTMLLLLIYTFSAYFLAMNSYEKELILGVLRKVIRK